MSGLLGSHTSVLLSLQLEAENRFVEIGCAQVHRISASANTSLLLHLHLRLMLLVLIGGVDCLLETVVWSPYMYL